MKKFLLLLIIIIICLSGCGRNNSDETSTATNSFNITESTASTLSTSTTTIQTSEEVQTTSKSIISEETKPPKEVGVRWNVPLIIQNPELPTGCEITSITMVANFYGYKYTKEEMNEKFLDKSENFFWEDNQFYGPNPNKFFLGNPTSSQGYGLQCFSGVWVNTLNKVFQENQSTRYAYSLNGKTLKELEVFLNSGPILISASISMEPITQKNYFKDFETGEEIFTYKNFHCMVLIGYDEENYYINDPLGNFEKVEKAKLQSVYESTGSQNTIIGVEKL